MERLFCILLVCFACTSIAVGQATEKITIQDELAQLYDFSLLPTLETNSVEQQVSSYDRTGGNDDGFSGIYSFVRRNPDSSLVLVDIVGCGVINRIATPTPTSDTLDIYIDDTVRPAASVCYMNLFSGNVSPFLAPLCGNGAGGYYCYFPILFQHSCRIVSRGKHERFHQIRYRLFPAGTHVESFTGHLTAKGRQAMEKVVVAWAVRVHFRKTTQDEASQVMKVLI